MFDPVTYEWVGEELSRVTIEGEIDGFKVVVYATEEDLKRFDEDGEFAGLSGMAEVGTIPALVAQVRDHGVSPAFRRQTGNASTPTQTEGAAQPKWTCPEHSGQYVYPAKFGSGLQCNRWEAATDRNNPPSWALTNVRDVNGQLRWYCKYREVYQKRTN
jgi:hypothetical protein